MRTAATSPEPACAPRARTLLLAAALLLALAACASKPKRAEPPPVAAEPPARPLPAPPTRPPPRPPAAAVATPAPARNFAQEKAQRKVELAAADPRNAVGAAEVGYYLDVLLGRLKQRLGPDTGVARHGQHVVVVMPAGTAFPVGETALPPALRRKLAPLAQVLVEYRRVLVSVYVRADASVVGASNPRLSQQRARVIAAYLGGAGIDPRRILTAPAAPSRPASPGSGGGNHGRIEIQLEPVLRPRTRS